MTARPSSDRPGPLRFESTAHDPSDSPHPRLAAAFAAWDSAPKVDGIPRRQSLAPELVPDAIGHIGLVDVLPGGAFRYRLFGSVLVAALGYDATGRCTDDLTPPEYAALITAQYRDVVAARRPILHEISSSGQRPGSYRYFRLTSPLTTDDGRVDQLWMTVAMLGSFGEEIFQADVTSLFHSRD